MAYDHTDGWRNSNDGLPEEGVEVETCIMDMKGMRNKQSLKRQGRLWFFPDESMYVYYLPTHWRPLGQKQ